MRRRRRFNEVFRLWTTRPPVVWAEETFTAAAAEWGIRGRRRWRRSRGREGRVPGSSVSGTGTTGFHNTEPSFYYVMFLLLFIWCNVSYAQNQNVQELWTHNELSRWRFISHVHLQWNKCSCCRWLSTGLFSQTLYSPQLHTLENNVRLSDIFKEEKTDKKMQIWQKSHALHQETEGNSKPVISTRSECRPGSEVRAVLKAKIICVMMPYNVLIASTTHLGRTSMCVSAWRSRHSLCVKGSFTRLWVWLDILLLLAPPGDVIWRNFS